ncbi:cytochrome P450 [Pseudonocardiaceae bacterium YIM PH 21723]|nr:cytochrome P450 [Pseudonocardiaceae bacterium YIM PH 21723]
MSAIITERAPSVLDDPERYLPIIDLSGPPLPFLGRLALTNGTEPLYADRFPGFYQLRTGSHAVVDELCDETRFTKAVGKGLQEIRPLAGDGLFTAFNDEPNWQRAHDLLLPSFAMSNMRMYHPTMLTVAQRMIRAWDAAAEAGRPVEVAEDATRMTLDTIGLAGFGYDFGSFDREQPHPFVDAMVGALSHAQRRIIAPSTVDEEQFQRDLATQFEIVDQVIAERLNSGDTRTDDLLGLMLNAPQEQRLSLENIRYQVITFLIAGHETTSGALSFALYNLARNPTALRLAQAEVDALWGDDPDPEPSYSDVAKLRYVRQCLDESLRLWPTAAGFVREARQDTVLAGRYPLRAGDPVVVSSVLLHRDPVWGDNVEDFDPGRFSPEAIAARPANAFKPFGTGERACIGRQFSLHESVMLLGMLIHRYRFITDPAYQLTIKQTLTIKPEGFELTLIPRTPADRAANRTALNVLPQPQDQQGPQVTGTVATGLTIAYGSNLGSCAEYAAQLAETAAELGVEARQVTLNELAGDLGTDPLLVITASYNGQPTDDADEFVRWLTEASDADVPAFAVLGVGDRGWAATYQRIPTLIDRRLGELGGRRLLDRGEVDQAADSASAVLDFATNYRAVLLAEFGESRAPIQSRAATPEFRAMTVVESYDMAPNGRPKRFVRLQLPSDVDYQTADHLVVLPENDPAVVQTTARALGVPATHLSTRELGDRLTGRQLTRLAELSPCPPDQPRILAIEPGTVNLADLAGRFPALREALTWPVLLDLLPPLRPRTYSISSSPRRDPRHVDLMVSLLPGGTGSTHLNRIQSGDVVLARVAPCRKVFRMDHTVPVIMVSAGTGLAPFRGAIADRTPEAPPALCYFGCDGPELDYLHRAELEASDAVSMRPTFSAAPENGHLFVQHRITAEAGEVWALLEQGAKVYVCGDGARMAPGVRAAFQEIYQGFTGEDGETWLKQLIADGRYVEDVYSGPQ